MRRFTALWAGQLLSLTGTALTSFALAVWLYVDTDSVTHLALNYLMAFVPGIIVSPWAGAIVDRWSRKRVLVLSDTIGILATLSLAALYAAGGLEPWHIYVTTAVRSAMAAFQLPAFGATVAVLVPRHQVSRANGMVLFAQALSQVAAPVTAGFLLTAIDVSGVILLDCATFVVGVGVLAFIRIPSPRAAEVAPGDGGSLLGEARVGWRYILVHPTLRNLMLFYAALNFCVGFVDVLVTPIVIGFGSPAALGVVATVAGIGMVAGSAVMTIWGGPGRPGMSIIGMTAALGVGLCVGASRPQVVPVCVGAFVFMFSAAIINTNTRSIWTTEAAPELQGRVLALQNMVTTSTLSVAYLLAGPVAGVFEPLLTDDGPLAGTAGVLFGTGAGRGMALLLFLIGAVVVLIALAGMFSRTLRSITRPEPADATPDDASFGAAGELTSIGTVQVVEGVPAGNALDEQVDASQLREQ
ncbi:MFS transporter [Actinophytocola sp.]|uniref:MFS transporter n=1 Tax=Actinophytocola sp. TaxID=1872138 RepID=UPI003D6BA63A